MLAVARMAVVGLAAKAVVEQMSAEDGHHTGYNEHPGGVRKFNELVQHKQQNTQRKHTQRQDLVVVALVAVPQRTQPNDKGNSQQQQFHPDVVHEVDTKQGQTAQQQRGNGAVNGADDRGTYAHGLPVDAEIH